MSTKHTPKAIGSYAVHPNGETKPLAKYAGYHFDRDGNIWSGPRHNFKASRIMKSQLKKRGYLEVRLYIKGKRLNLKVHNLICEAVRGPRPIGLQVRHLNGNKTDNRPVNLVWGTRRENAADAMKHGHYNCGIKHSEAIKRGLPKFGGARVKRTLPKPINGMRLIWSPVNQAYFLMWHDQVLRIISDRADAIAEFNRCTSGGAT